MFLSISDTDFFSFGFLLIKFCVFLFIFLLIKEEKILAKTSLIFCCSVSLDFINNKYQVLRFSLSWTKVFWLSFVISNLINLLCFFCFGINQFLSIETSQWYWHIVEFVVVEPISIICYVKDFFVYGRPIGWRLAKKSQSLMEYQLYDSHQFD